MIIEQVNMGAYKQETSIKSIMSINVNKEKRKT